MWDQPDVCTMYRSKGLFQGVEDDEEGYFAMLALTQLSNYLTLKGSFSAVPKPNFASKYALENSRRDLQNAHRSNSELYPT